MLLQQERILASQRSSTRRQFAASFIVYLKESEFYDVDYQRKFNNLGKPNRIPEDHAVYLKDGLIADVGPQVEMVSRYANVERLDARGQYVMPGNICAHTHFYGAFARKLPWFGKGTNDKWLVIGNE